MAELSARALVKHYGARPVVHGVDLDVAAATVVGLLGPNGAGKTTTFYMVSGFVRPDAGQVLLDGVEITWLPIHDRARLGVSYLAQEPSVFRRLSVVENLRLVLEPLGLPRAEIRSRIEALLDDLRMGHLADHRADTLSGGERRRVEIMRALAIGPRFVLLDEPFAGIDPLSVADLQGIIRGLKERGLGVLISDHNVRETLSICDHAYIISEGHILTAGDPAAIVASDIARQHYLGEGFRL
ncbi:MAG: LPS export ABC transporter ATP-binding protein [Thermodesulfobacteriota bacterium]